MAWCQVRGALSSFAPQVPATDVDPKSGIVLTWSEPVTAGTEVGRWGGPEWLIYGFGSVSLLSCFSRFFFWGGGNVQSTTKQLPESLPDPQKNNETLRKPRDSQATPVPAGASPLRAMGAWGEACRFISFFKEGELVAQHEALDLFANGALSAQQLVLGSQALEEGHMGQVA